MVQFLKDALDGSIGIIAFIYVFLLLGFVATLLIVG